MNSVLELLVKAGNFVSNIGSMVMIPVILVIVGLFFRISLPKAIRSGLLVGAGFVGLNLVTGLLTSNIGVAAKLLFERFHLNLKFVDGGWAAAAGIAYSTEVGALIIPVILAVNILLLFLHLTRTVNIDIWNFWHFAFAGSMVMVLTGSMFYGFLAAIAYCVFSLRLADYIAKNMQDVLGMEGITITESAAIATAPIAMVMDKIYDHIPVLKDAKGDVRALNRKMGALGEPVVIGFVLGIVLGAVCSYGFRETVELGINLGAVMLMMPRMVKVIMEGLLPISEAAREFMQKRFSGEEYYIGLDSALACGHENCVAISVLIIPFYILFAIITPGNQTLPFGALAGTVFAGCITNGIHRGNFVRTYLTCIIQTVIGLYIGTLIGPLFTQLAKSIGYQFPEGATGITYYCPGGWAYSTIIYSMKYKMIGVVIVAVLLVGWYYITREKSADRKYRFMTATRK
ncbi:MAG: hypothetical protein KH230_11875 [Enterocloster asparagiformis]|nr:hypothetical protein [Enterocloster asparagiformis]